MKSQILNRQKICDTGNVILTKYFIYNIANNGYNHDISNSKPVPFPIKFYTLKNSIKLAKPVDQGTKFSINKKPSL